MNIRNYHKYFSDHTVKSSITTKDSFGALSVGTSTKTIRGYISRSLTNTRDGDNIPTTVSGGILFTDPNVHLTTGDIVDDKFQIIDYDRHPSHNEYSVKLVDRYGDERSPEMV